MKWCWIWRLFERRKRRWRTFLLLESTSKVAMVFFLGPIEHDALGRIRKPVKWPRIHWTNLGERCSMSTLLGMGQNLLFHIMSIYFLHVWRDGHPEQGTVPFVFWPIAGWNINISHSQDCRQHRTTPGNAVRYPTFDGGCHPQETCRNSRIGVRFYRLSGRLTCIEAFLMRGPVWYDVIWNPPEIPLNPPKTGVGKCPMTWEYWTSPEKVAI